MFWDMTMHVTQDTQAILFQRILTKHVNTLNSVLGFQLEAMV